MKTSKRNKTESFLIYGILSFVVFISLSSSGYKEISPDQIGVCTDYHMAAILKDKGYSYIEGGVSSILAPTLDDTAYDSILADIRKSELPIKSCNSFIPGSLKSVGPDAVHKEVLNYMETAFRRAEQVGVEIIVFGSGGSRSIPDGFSRNEARSQFISLCSKMAPIAAKYNVVVVLEPLNKLEVNFINSVSEGGEIVKEVNHPNFRLLADIYHMLMENESPETIIEYGSLIKHIHIAEKEGRSAPGTHNEDFTAYFDALKSIKYKGRISIECK